MTGLSGYMAANVRRQAEFFSRSRPGDLLVYATCLPEGVSWIGTGTPSNNNMELPDPITEEFLASHAYDMGVKAVRDAMVLAEHQYNSAPDDFCPCLLFHLGAGYYAALFTGVEVRFFGGGLDSSYTVRRAIKDWDDIPRVFNLDNKWVAYTLEFWRGVQSQDLCELTVAPAYCRTPLDLANDLRGDQLFTDLYDAPQEVEVLLEHCARNIIALDKVMRAEIPILREQLGGALGTVLRKRGMLFNGDPLDLISEEMGERFNNPYMEMITDYAGGVLLHHHSIGASRANCVSRIKGLTVQEIQQDPNGPRLTDMVDEKMIEASFRAPIQLEWLDDDSVSLIDHTPDLDALLEKVQEGRFILHIVSSDPVKCRWFVETVRQVSRF